MTHLLHRWRALWHPERFHGWGRRRSYFEGWYYKLVAPDGGRAIAVIPGISYDAQGEGHAFIQWMDGTAGQAWYHEFPVSDFRPAPDRFRLELGGNVFSDRELQVDLPGLRADLTLHDPHPWPRRRLAPGIMGWYSFVPFMECYHGLVSMDHRLRGEAVIQGEAHSFDDGRGYLEKDWGTSFPACWVWLQTNHFRESETPTSLFASVARIPWLGNFFIGFIVAFLWEGRVYSFATYLGSERQATLAGETVRLAFRSRTHELRLEAVPGTGVALKSPLSGTMTGKVNESLQATVKVALRERGGKLLFSGTGEHAGLEVAGDTDVLWTDHWRS